MTQPPWGPAPDASGRPQWTRSQTPWSQNGAAPWGGPVWTNAPGQALPQAQGGFPLPGAPQPPRRRRSLFGSLLRTALLIFVALTALGFVRGLFADPTTPAPAPTRTQTTQTTPAAQPKADPSATPGTGGGTGGTSSGSTTSDGTGVTQYQNEGYQAPPADFDPPDLPLPTTYSQAGAWLTQNAIYAQNVPSPTNCTMQPIQSGSTKAELEKKLNDMMGCLMQVWEPPIVAAGFQMPRPPVTVYTSPVTTACGTMKEVNAAYCAGDQRVYYAKALLTALPSNVAKTKYAAEEVIAHEFGHAVQARTGILIADKALEKKASDADATVMSRRTEVQADCFAGLYVQSVARSQGLATADLKALVDMTYYLGDDVLSGRPNIDGDHGLGKTRQAWFAQGLSTNRVGACNTWTPPASQVR